MKYVIDRFEGDYAVVETDNGVVNMPKVLLPGACEGDTIEITLLKEETVSKKEAQQKRLNKLFGKGD